MFDLTGLLVEDYTNGSYRLIFNDVLVSYYNNNPIKNIDNEIMGKLYTIFLYMFLKDN